MGWSKEMMMGDRLDANNVFRLAAVRTNFPGSAEYDPMVQ
jgi:hypothetical protein